MDTVADSTTPPTHETSTDQPNDEAKNADVAPTVAADTNDQTAPNPRHRWQLPRSPRYRRNRRWLLVSSIALAISLTAFVWAVLSPFNRPQHRLLLISTSALPTELADDLLMRTTPTLQHPLQDLFRPFMGPEKVSTAVPLDLIEPSSTTKLLPMIRSALASAQLSRRDEILCLSEFALVCRNGSLDFCGRIDPADPEAEAVRFQDLTQAIVESTPARVTLFLDTEHVVVDTRVGLLQGEYDAIRRLVSQGMTDCPNIHVVLARPQDTADRAETTPAFAEILAAGWQGAADANEDDVVELRELLEYAGQFQAVELLDRNGLVNTERQTNSRLPVLKPVPTQADSNSEESAPDWQMPLRDGKTSTDGSPPPLATLSTAELLAKCWRLRDQTTSFEVDDPLRRRRLKSDFAPATWRRMGEQLIALERIASWPHPKVLEELKPWLLSRCEDLTILTGGTGDLSFTPDWMRRFTCPIGDDFAWNKNRWPLAFHELAAELSSTRAETDIANARQVLNQFVQNDAGDSESETSLDQNLVASFAELHFLSQLKQNSHLDDSQIRLAIETHILAERLAASCEASTWFADEILATDRLRVRADRLLVANSDTKTRNRAVDLYRECLSTYHSLATRAESIVAASETCDATLKKLPCYRKLLNQRRSSSEPLDDAFLNYVDAVQHTLVLLASHDPNRLAEIGRRRRAAAAAESRLRRLLGLESEHRDKTLVSLGQLQSDLFSTETRLRSWQQSLTERPTRQSLLNETQPASKRIAHFDFQPVSLETLLSRCRREVAFARLLQPISKMQSPFDGEIGRLHEAWTQLEHAAADWLASEKPAAESVFHTRLNRFAAQLESCHANISTVLANGQSADEHDVVHLLTLIDPRERVPEPVEATTKRLRFKDWETVLRFQLRKRLCFEADATPEERSRLCSEQKALAQELLRLNPLSAIRLGGNSLEYTIEIDDNTSSPSSEITWRLQLYNRSSAVLPVWMWLSELPQEIQCSLSPELTTQVVVGHSDSSPFPPYSTNRPNAVPSLILDAGERREVIGTLRISTGYVTPGTLVLRLVTPGNQTSSMDGLARDAFHTDRIEVPWFTEFANLASWASSSNSLLTQDRTRQRVAGWPSRIQKSICRLSNPSGQDRTVEIRCFRKSHSDDLSLPNHKLSREAANQLLLSDEFESPLFVIPNITLPAGNLNIPLVCPKLELKQPLDISHGLTLFIRDLKTGAASCLNWQGLPHDPLASIVPQVDYHADRRQVRTTLRWQDDVPIPVDGIPVRMSLTSPFDDSILCFRATVLKPEEPEQTVVLDCLDDSREKYRVTIDMSGWPRILSYDVDTNRSMIDMAPVSGPPTIRILSPPINAAFTPKHPTLPIRLRVDAPRGRNGAQPVRLSLGLDKAQNRWPESQVWQLHGDRQIRAELHGISEEGQLIWQPRVTDFDFELPIDSTGEERLNLVGVVEKQGEQARAFVPLVFDGQGPKIRGAEILSPAELMIDSTITLSIDADDEGLSGTDRVEVTVDELRSGEFPDGDKPKRALLSDQGRWIVQLPMKGLPAGVVNVLVRGIDAVGNVGPTYSKPIQLLDPTEVALRREARLPAVTGRVVYVNQPIANAALKLTPVSPDSSDATPKDTRTPLSTKTNQQGAFVFPHVPPGAWTVQVIGSVSGFRSQQEWPLNVAATPATQPIRLDLARRSDPEESTAQ